MKKNLPLIVGISLPIFFILIISIVIFTPSLFINPQYNFLYSSEDPSYSYNQTYANTYIVKDNHLSLEPNPTNPGTVFRGESPTLFLYDVNNNSTHQIDFIGAKNFIIDPGPSSPDGYIVKYQYSNDGIFGLFGSSSNQNGYFISKGNGSRKLDGLNTNGLNYYSNNFKFIGWIK